MKTLTLLAVLILSASCEKPKRGLFGLGDATLGLSGLSLPGTDIRITNTYGVRVPVPHAVPVERIVPVGVLQPYAVPVDRPYAVAVPKPVAVPIHRPVAVPVDAPYAVPVPQPVAVPIAKPIPVAVHQPILLKHGW